MPGYKLAHRGCKVIETKHKRSKHSKSCAVTKTLGRFTHTDTAGGNSFKFSGRLHGHLLAAGFYALTATPALNSPTGSTITAHFHVH